MGSGISTSRPANSNEKKKKVAKIPLNIALVAIIKIQSQYRKKLAQRRFEEIREIVMEERRLEELRREEEEEQNAVEESPMITSSMQGSTKNPSMNHRNRFMRKVLPADQLATLAEDNTFISMPTFDPTSVMSKYSPLDSEHVIIYPLVGFVVKSRSNITGKKIFLNICHHEAVMTMESTAVREINDSTAAVFSRDFSSSLLPTLSSVGRPSTATSNSLLLGGGAVVASTMIQIGDVILPSSEYEECFSYDEDLGMVPIDASIKQEIARQAIKFWNITHQEDISDTCTFPKMKRGYFGDILPLTLNLKNKSLAHLPAALKDSQWSSVKDTRNSDEGRLSFSSLNSSTKDNHERFVLPYATELRSWVDLSSIRTRKEIEGTAIPTAATAHALAVIEHATAPKLANHSVKFSSRKVTHGTVELVTPRIFVPQVPLFGPAYAAELMATLPTPDVPAVFPAVSSSRTAAGGGGIGFGDADVSSLIVPASPGAVSASGSAAGSGHFTPQRPPGAKQARSATTGPGMLTAAATSGTPESSNKSTHRTLTSAAATTASRNNRGPPGQLNLESFEEENDDEMSLSFVAQSTPQSNTSFQQMATPGRGGKEMSVHRGPKDISASRIGGSSESSVHRANKQDLSFHKTMSMSQQQQSGRFDSPSKTSPQSQHFSFANMGFSEPSEFPTTTPVFVVLSQGMLYVYNRDPTRGTYYPYVSNPAAAAAGQPRKINSVPSSSSLNTVRGAGSNNNNSVGTSKSVNKHEYRPLIEYARIMLTEDCITTSHFLTQTSTTFFLHFHAPLANKVSPEDTLAVLYSHFSDVVPGGNVTIQLRSFSELRTWKAHLRSHILAGTAARRRVIMDYIGNTMINKSPINRKLTPKFGEVQCLQYPDLPKVFVKIEHGLVQIYDEKIAGDTAGKNLLKAVQLMDKCVNVRTEPQKDNSTNIILTLDVAENSVFSHGGGVDADEMYGKD